MTALRSLTDDEVSTYERDGFVKLAGVLPLGWVDAARAVVDSMYERGIVRSEGMATQEARTLAAGGRLLRDGTGAPTGQSCSSFDQWRAEPALGALCVEGPLPELAAQLFRSSKVNFLIDQIFLKEKGASQRTAFHCDESYFNCEGDQCATFWIPMDVVDKSNGAMGYVPGSHLWGTAFKRNNFVSQTADPSSEGEQLPDIEGREEEFGVRYLDSQPGDILVHHYRTVHGATGNVSSTRMRRALALRFGGADLRYKVRYPVAMLSDSISEGDPMDSPDFPVVWNASPSLSTIGAGSS